MNGSKVVEILDDAVVVESQERIYLYTIDNKDIKSLVTKEQFNRMEYKLED